MCNVYEKCINLNGTLNYIVIPDIYISRITSRLFVSCVICGAHKMFEYNKKKESHENRWTPHIMLSNTVKLIDFTPRNTYKNGDDSNNNNNNKRTR